MNIKIVASVSTAVLLCSYLAAQDASAQEIGPLLRLSPVELDEETNPAEPTRQPPDGLESAEVMPAPRLLKRPPASELPNDDQPKNRGLSTDGPTTDIGQRDQNRPDPQLSQLGAPLGRSVLQGIVKSPDAPNVVSSLGSNVPPKWISGALISDPTIAETVTVYPRRPLYFEDAPLERCGRSTGYLGSEKWLSRGIWTNGRSAARFLIDTTLLPYRMIRQHPDELIQVTAQ